MEYAFCKIFPLLTYNTVKGFKVIDIYQVNENAFEEFLVYRIITDVHCRLYKIYGQRDVCITASKPCELLEYYVIRS